jgi:hypothetical protein
MDPPFDYEVSMPARHAEPRNMVFSQERGARPIVVHRKERNIGQIY